MPAPYPPPFVQPLARALVQSLVLLPGLLCLGCASLGPAADAPPPAMLEPEPLQEASRTDQDGEPFYLDYQIGEIGIAHAFDDGAHTFIEFNQPVPSELSCFDDQGALLVCEAVSTVLAIQGVHQGILLRHGEAAGYIAPNPKARPASPRPLGHQPSHAAHIQARNRVLLKAPLRAALSRSAGIRADPEINQAAGLRTSASLPPPAAETSTRRTHREETAAGLRRSRSSRTTRATMPPSAGPSAIRNDESATAGRSAKPRSPAQAPATAPAASAQAAPASPDAVSAGSAQAAATMRHSHNTAGPGAGWNTLPFGRNTAQLDPAHPALGAMAHQASQADEIHIELPAGATSASAASASAPGQQLLVLARLQATRRWLVQQGVPASRIRVIERQLRPTQQRAGAKSPMTQPPALMAAQAARSPAPDAWHHQGQAQPGAYATDGLRILLMREGRPMQAS